jgi:hypothetical protein
MRTAPPPPVESLSYEAFGAERPAERLGDVGGSRGTLLMLSGLAMFGLDTQRPAARDLLAFGDELAAAIVSSRRCVIRPLAFDAERDADGCIAAATSLIELTRSHANGPLIVLGLSAAAPLLAVVGAGARCDGFVLVSPPILETYGNRPDRLDLPLAEALGIPPKIASELGAAAPMHLGASVSPRALVVHGAADRIVPPSDAIGWRASLAAAGVEAARLEVAFAGHDLAPCRDAAITGILHALDAVGPAT